MNDFEARNLSAEPELTTAVTVPRKKGFSKSGLFALSAGVLAAIYGLDMCTPESEPEVKAKTKLAGVMNPGGANVGAEAAEQQGDRFDWLPEYPIRRKIGVIMSGDSRKTRHVENAERAVRVLKTRGFDEIYVAQTAKVDGVKQFSGDKAGLDKMFQAIKPELKEDTLVFVYGTGHGSDQENGALVMDDEPIGFDEMQAYLSQIAAKKSKAIVVFDNCSSGEFAGLVHESGLQGLLVSPGKGSDTTSCQDYAPIFFDELEKGIDVNGDKSTEVYEAHVAAMRNYRAKLSEKETGTYVQSKIELTEDNYERVLSTGKPVLIDLTAPWCGWCQKLKPEIDKVISRVGGGLTVCTITLDEPKINQNPQAVLSKLNIKAGGLPSLFIRKDGDYELLSGQAGFRAANVLLQELQEQAGVKTMDEHIGQRGEYAHVSGRSRTKKAQPSLKKPEPVKTPTVATSKPVKPQSDYEKKMTELQKSTQSIIEQMQRRAQGLKEAPPVAPQAPAQPAQPSQSEELADIIKKMQERAKRLKQDKP